MRKTKRWFNSLQWGNIEFGERLNTQDQAEGKAEVLRNKSGIIEAEGGIGLSGVKKTFNTNEHFVTEKIEVPEEGKNRIFNMS